MVTGPHAPRAGRPGEPALLVLLAAMSAGFATAVTFLGPLLVDLGRDLEVDLAAAGMLAAATAIPWAVAAPFAGMLSDRVGRRRALVLGLVGTGVGCMLGAEAPSFGTLFVTRAIVGLFGALGPTSLMSAAAEVFPPQRRGAALGSVNLGFGLAALGGVPVLTAIGGLLGWRASFVAVGGALLAAAVVAHLALPPLNVAAARETGGFGALFGVPGLPTMLAANLLERMLFNVVALYFPSFLVLSYGLATAQVAPFLVLIAVGSLAGTALGAMLGDRLPRLAVYGVGQLASAAAATAVFGVAPGALTSVLLGATFGLLDACARPAFLAVSADLAPSRRGTVLGLLSLTSQGGAVLGAAVGGGAIAWGGYPTLALVLGPAGAAAAALALRLRGGAVSTAHSIHA